MDMLFLIAILIILGCWMFRKQLGVFMRNKKQPAGELPMVQEKPLTASYRVLAYNARDYKDTKELENMMELRLEQCLSGLAKQGSQFEVEFHAQGFVMVYLVKFWY